jgi:tellurite methyltransferase
MNKILEKEENGNWNTIPSVPPEVLKNVNCHKFVLYVIDKISWNEMVSDPSTQKELGEDFTFGEKIRLISNTSFTLVRSEDELKALADKSCEVGKLYVGQVLDQQTNEMAHSFILRRESIDEYVCFDKPGFKYSFEVSNLNTVLNFINKDGEKSNLNQEWRFVPIQNNGWKEYFENTKNKPPRALLVKALEYIGNRDSAIDLGSGALNDSMFLLKEGFKKVVALDKELVGKEVADSLPSDQFEYVISSLESFKFSTTFDLINAQYSLPFINPEQFESVFQKIKLALKEGGIFVGQFFGDRDEWASDNEMTFHTKEQATNLLSDFEILLLEEKENDRPTAAGVMKHWHVFDFIVRN